jgi:hypothetical protein
MVRPFTLRDLALVRRLGVQGISLHAESALADELHHVRDALTSMVVGGKYPTLIYKSEEPDRTGFIQLLLQEVEHHAHILYLSPAVQPAAETELFAASSSEAAVWLSLLDEAVAEVGRLGIHSLVAEVDENGPELSLLRRAGFAVYTRQDIWRFADEVANMREPAVRLLPYLSTDDWDVQLLYANTVPRLVQLVEPVPPTMSGDGWVLRDERNELTAFVHVNEGSAAAWLRFFIHPSAEAEASEIVRTALVNEVERRRKPVYCCVRRYEGWLPSGLEDAGFSIWRSQAVLVKHTVQHTRQKEPRLAVKLENTGMPATSPFVRRYPLAEQQEDSLNS